MIITDRIEHFVSFLALNDRQLCDIIEAQVLKAGTGCGQQIADLFALDRLIAGHLRVPVKH